jgi:hypothetical protein
MATRTAELHITVTSPTCTRYTLVDLAGGVVIWINRVVPTDAGHAGARSRMASWALRHHVIVVQPQPARVRVGRH